MYIVHNPTTKTIILSDLRAEIGPRKILDLEKITHRDAIDRSHALRQALNNNQLRLVKYSVVKTHVHRQSEEPNIKIIERDKLDDNRLKDIIRQTIVEEMNKSANSNGNFEGTVKRVLSESVQDLKSSIRDQINNLNIVPNKGQDQEYEDIIDPIKLAELKQQSIKKISEDIETNKKRENKKINIVNTKISDLADEL